jgi:hypothetical protein
MPELYTLPIPYVIQHDLLLYLQIKHCSILFGCREIYVSIKHNIN